MNEKLEELLRKVPFKQSMSNPKLYIRFTNPLTGWSWYITEYNINTGKCFGYIKGIENEWDYFTIQEIASMGCLFDIEFRACTFKEFTKGKEVE